MRGERKVGRAREAGFACVKEREVAQRWRWTGYWETGRTGFYLSRSRSRTQARREDHKHSEVMAEVGRLGRLESRKQLVREAEARAQRRRWQGGWRCLC